uniref:Regulator of G-protein signaling 5 n=1 Tax=Sphaerodactylus townsendi TaxID=933632 RepID=A0ACB8F2P1_9SAUR
MSICSESTEDGQRELKQAEELEKQLAVGCFIDGQESHPVEEKDQLHSFSPFVFSFTNYLVDLLLLLKSCYLRPSPEEAWQWRNSLEKLLQNPYGLASFRNFLQSEFSEENIEFWIACEDYKKIKFPAKMAEKAKKIYEEFIQSEAPKEVNIDHFTKSVTMKNLVEPSVSTFDLAQKRIFTLMEKDSLPRYVRSDIYQGLIK